MGSQRRIQSLDWKPQISWWILSAYTDANFVMWKNMVAFSVMEQEKIGKFPFCQICAYIFAVV